MRNCNESPPGRLLLAIRQFNERKWFECHETLEDLWIGEEGETRDFFQGVLQVAVALHHWRNGNYRGAILLLTGGVTYLGKIHDSCMWVDVARIIADANSMREALEKLGPERMDELDPALVPLLKTVSK